MLRVVSFCRAAVSVVAILLSMPRPALPAEGVLQAPSVAAILDRARPALHPPKSLTCRADATVAFEKHAPVVLHLAYSFLAPDHAKLVVLSRLARPTDIDFFEHKVGMAYVLNGPTAASYQPFFMKGSVVDTKLPENEPTVSDVYGTGNMASIAPWLAGMLHISRREYIKARYLRCEEVKGAEAHVVEFTFDQSVYAMMGHRIARYVKWFSVDKGVPIQAVAYNEKGETVAETVYEALKQVAPSKWVALRTRKTIREGTVAISRDVTVTRKRGKPTPATWGTRLAFPARTVVHEYEWVDGRAALPSTVAVWDDSGNLVFHVRFFEYVLDAGLSESEFEYEPVP